MDVYTALYLRYDCKFSKLFMYLKRTPASSGRLWPASAAIFFGVICPGGPVQQGVALLVLICPFLVTGKKFFKAKRKFNISQHNTTQHKRQMLLVKVVAL